MVSGQMMCLGRLPDLQQKFCKGYTLKIYPKKLVDLKKNEVIEAVNTEFPSATLKDGYQVMHSLFRFSNILHV